MQSANIRQIKAALVDQAFTGRTRVSCAIGTVVAVRRRKGQLLAMIRGWGGRWYSVDSVSIVYAGRTLHTLWSMAMRISPELSADLWSTRASTRHAPRCQEPETDIWPNSKN
jgi:hypothetical protein